MRKLFVPAMILTTVLISFCTSSKTVTDSRPVRNYNSDVQPLIVQHCSPCHIPPKGNKEAFDTYAAASTHIDSMIARMDLQPGQKGFMPFKHPKLPDSTIQVFRDWKAGGLKEN